MHGVSLFSSRHFLKPGAIIVAALAVALRMMPALWGQEPDANPAPARETIEFEGIRIGFPKGEADVVEVLKPALLEFRRERRRLAGLEAEAFATAPANVDARKMFGRQIAAVMGREAPGDGLEARFASRTAIFRKFAEAWQKWSGDISEIQLWAPDELQPFQTRPDGGEDEDGKAFRFPQISFGKDGSKYAFRPPFTAALLGLDVMRNVEKGKAPLRLDFPLFYKPGESPEKIAEFAREFLKQLPAVMGKNFAKEFAGMLPYWVFEYLVLGEIQTWWVDAATARDTALAEALARTLLFVHILNHQGEQKTVAQMSQLFPFETDEAPSAAENLISAVEKMDPLASVDPAKAAERILARNLIALTFVKIAQVRVPKVQIFHQFKEAGIAIPEARFNVASFTDAVDEAYGEKGFFRRMLAAQQRETAGQLRESLKRKTDQPKTAPPPVTTPPAIATPANRDSAKYDGLTITFPPELKGTMAVLGPQCAKALADTRTMTQGMMKSAATTRLPDVTEQDLAAYRTYGLEANAGVMRSNAAATTVFRDTRSLLTHFFSGDQVAVWFREDLIRLLKAGTEVPGFTLNPDGESGGWGFKWNLKFGPEDFQRLSLAKISPAEEFKKRLATLAPPVLPIIIKKADIAAKLNDPVATAAAIRAAEHGLFGMLLNAEKEPLKESDFAGLNLQLMDDAQAWFLVAHESAESAIVSGTIKSADRRWFCDGLANRIAVRDVDRRFGAGKGAEAFAKNYDAAEMKKQAGTVNLLAWPAAEDIENGSHPEVENSTAHYYFATLAIEKACAGQEADFVKRWLKEIRRTPLNRTNSGTVIAAYQKLTGKDLAAIIAEVVR